MFVTGAFLYQCSPKHIKTSVFEITPDGGCQVQTIESARAHVGDVIIVWRNTHNSKEPNAIWFPATLTDTDMSIQGIRVKYRTNRNCNIPAQESRLWRTRWYNSFSVQIYILRRRDFGNVYTKDFNWTFKNCVSWRGSSKGSVIICPLKDTH